MAGFNLDRIVMWQVKPLRGKDRYLYESGLCCQGGDCGGSEREEMMPNQKRPSARFIAAMILFLIAIGLFLCVHGHRHSKVLDWIGLLILAAGIVALVLALRRTKQPKVFITITGGEIQKKKNINRFVLWLIMWILIDKFITGFYFAISPTIKVGDNVLIYTWGASGIIAGCVALKIKKK
jgi:hypothetical protein